MSNLSVQKTDTKNSADDFMDYFMRIEDIYRMFHYTAADLGLIQYWALMRPRNLFLAVGILVNMGARLTDKKRKKLEKRALALVTELETSCKFLKLSDVAAQREVSDITLTRIQSAFPALIACIRAQLNVPDPVREKFGSSYLPSCFAFPSSAVLIPDNYKMQWVDWSIAFSNLIKGADQHNDREAQKQRALQYWEIYRREQATPFKSTCETVDYLEFEGRCFPGISYLITLNGHFAQSPAKASSAMKKDAVPPDIDWSNEQAKFEEDPRLHLKQLLQRTLPVPKFRKAI